MKNDKQAFTLIELLVVVLIIAILVAVAVPQYKKAVLKSRYIQLITAIESIAKAQEIYYLQKGKYGELSSLDISLENASHYQIGLDLRENSEAISGWLLPDSNLRYIRFLEHTTHKTKKYCRAFSSKKIYHSICASLTQKPIKSLPSGENHVNYLFP